VLRRHLSILLCALIVLMILSGGEAAAQAFQAKISNVVYSSTVKVGSRVDIKVVIKYSFPQAVKVPVRVSLLDVDTGGILSARPVEELDGDGQRPYDFSESAPDVTKTWKLKAIVESRYMYAYEFTRDDEREFSIEVRSRDSSLELRGLPPNSWVRIGANNLTVGSSGILGMVLSPGKHSVEIPREVKLAPDKMQVFKQWADGYPTTSRDIVLETDMAYFLVYETWYLLSLQSELETTLKGKGWYKEGTPAIISVDPREIPEKGFLGILGAKRIFDSWVRDDGENLVGSPSATIVMDRAYVVQARWKLVYDEVYLRLGIIAIVIFIIIAVLLMMSRRKPLPLKPMITGTTYGVPMRSSVSHGAPSRPTPVLLRPPPIREKKFCMHCGAAMESAATRCQSCGRET